MHKSDIRAINEAYSAVNRGAVYVAIQAHVNVDGGVQLGTYSSLERAQAAVQAYVKEKGRVYYNINVYEVVVDRRPSDNDIGKRVWYWQANKNKGVSQQ